jgi:hypothetical protein
VLDSAILRIEQAVHALRGRLFQTYQACNSPKDRMRKVRQPCHLFWTAIIRLEHLLRRFPFQRHRASVTTLHNHRVKCEDAVQCSHKLDCRAHSIATVFFLQLLGRYEFCHHVRLKRFPNLCTTGPDIRDASPCSSARSFHHNYYTAARLTSSHPSVLQTVAQICGEDSRTLSLRFLGSQLC